MGQALRVIDEAVPEHSPLSLELPGDLPFEAWVDVGRRLCIGSQAINWHIGDWWAFGDHRYGERAKAAAEGIFGREFQTLANLASVSRTFEPSRRREVLTFSHHAEVAGLANSDPKLAETLLDRAAEEHLSKAALRREVQALRVANDTDPHQVRSVEQSRAKPQPFAKHELAEAYSRYVEAMEQLETFRPLTRRESDYLTVALDYLGEAHAERRAVPDDFDIVFVEQGRLACESWYRASRITVNRWLAQRGKRRLIEERSLFVKHQRAQAHGEPKAADAPTMAAVDSYLPIAKMAADHIRQSRYGRWPVSMAQDGNGWFVGTARRTSEELIAMAERQGFDVESAKLEARQEGY